MPDTYRNSPIYDTPVAPLGLCKSGKLKIPIYQSCLACETVCNDRLGNLSPRVNLSGKMPDLWVLRVDFYSVAHNYQLTLLEKSLTLARG